MNYLIFHSRKRIFEVRGVILPALRCLARCYKPLTLLLVLIPRIEFKSMLVPNSSLCQGESLLNVEPIHVATLKHQLI